MSQQPTALLPVINNVEDVDSSSKSKESESLDEEDKEEELINPNALDPTGADLKKEVTRDASFRLNHTPDALIRGSPPGRSKSFKSHI